MASQPTWGVFSNDENMLPDDAKKRVLRPRGTQGITKRSALSVINNVPVKTGKNQGAIKKPTIPASKLPTLIQPPQAPNVEKPVASKFTIFRDNSVLTEAECISDNITKLFKHEPIATKSIPELISPDETDDENSPMVLDCSTDQSTLDTTSQMQTFFCSRIYDKDIYAYLRGIERKFRPSPSYIRKQPDINESMRSILVDWMVEVVQEYKMHTETLYLSVYYIDRFLSQMSVQKSKLQLVGTACMFVASKLEEIYPPELSQFVYITDDTYTKRQILRMEHMILKVLAFDLTAPTAYYFLQHLCCVGKVSEKVKYLAQYICELALLDIEPFLAFMPSEMAASSLYLANHTLDQEPWTQQAVEITGYSVNDLATCIKAMYQKHRTICMCPQRAITEKYKSSRYEHVAMIKPIPLSVEIGTAAFC